MPEQPLLEAFIRDDGLAPPAQGTQSHQVIQYMAGCSWHTAVSLLGVQLTTLDFAQMMMATPCLYITCECRVTATTLLLACRRAA